MNLHATYGGVVESVSDPLKLGRAKVRVPHVYGIVQGAGAGYVTTNDLPWALPAGLPAGGSASSGGLSHLPAVGDHVFVRFLDGEPEKPIWEWGMQTLNDAEQLPLHAYDENGGVVGDPKRAAWTRYGHVVELNAGGVIVTTSQGYRTVYTDASAPGALDGNVATTTPNGNEIRLDDESNTIRITSMSEITFDAVDEVSGQSDSFFWQTATGDIEFYSGNTFYAESADAMTLNSVGDFTLESLAGVQLTSADSMVLDFLRLQFGSTATEPLVLGTQMTTFLTSLLTWLSTHTHGNGNNGNPTTPPLVPPLGVVQPPVASLISNRVYTT